MNINPQKSGGRTQYLSVMDDERYRSLNLMISSDKIITIADPNSDLLEKYLEKIKLMRFYTNVQMVGDHFLVRGYENGRHFATREKFYPTLFVPSNKKTKYKTLEGEYVESVEPGTVRECREFIKKYEGVDNFKMYGNDRYIYQYISEMYPEEEIKFDTNKIKISTLDIEVASENGFPDVESAAEEVLLITIQDYNTKQIHLGSWFF